MIKEISTLIVLAFGIASSAQVFLDNTQDIDESRYQDYSGNPYYFEDHQKAEVYIVGDEKAFELEQVNVNLLSESVEIFRGDKFIELGKKKVEKVVFNYDGINVTLKPDNTRNSGFQVELYHSSNYKLFQSINAITDERVYNTPGKTMVKQYIRKKEKFKIEISNKSHEVSIKKKEVLGVLGKDAEKVMKKTKNKMKSHWDLVHLLSALEKDI